MSDFYHVGYGRTNSAPGTGKALTSKAEPQEILLNLDLSKDLDFKALKDALDQSAVDAMRDTLKGKSEEESWLIKTKEEAESQELARLLKYFQESAKQAKNKFQYKVNSSVFSSGGEVSGMLVRAETVQSVRSVMATASEKMFQLRMVISLGSDEDQRRARAALSKLERVIMRAEEKVKNLQGEAQMERRRKKAEDAQNQKRAEQIKLELKKKRAARAAREHAQRYEKGLMTYSMFSVNKTPEERQREEALMAEMIPTVGGEISSLEAGVEISDAELEAALSEAGISGADLEGAVTPDAGMADVGGGAAVDGAGGTEAVALDVSV